MTSQSHNPTSLNTGDDGDCKYFLEVVYTDSPILAVTIPPPVLPRGIRLLTNCEVQPGIIPVRIDPNTGEVESTCSEEKLPEGILVDGAIYRPTLVVIGIWNMGTDGAWNRIGFVDVNWAPQGDAKPIQFPD